MEGWDTFLVGIAVQHEYMVKKILITRLVGLGDVASILIPAVRMVSRAEPEAQIDVLTFNAGAELMSLCTEVDNVLRITQEQWPRDLRPATQSFLDIAKVIAIQGYDRVICLDTWFMPCFMARVLKDVGLQVEGNFLNLPIEEFFLKLNSDELPASYFQHANFLTSSYPNMKDWATAWWLKAQGYAHYPEFYLKHCCGFQGAWEMSLSIELDNAFKEQAKGKRIIALSFTGSTAYKSYPHQEELTDRLRDEGYVVWSRFDGSLPMRSTLARLAATDLLVTVATSTQWLGKLVGCPSLMLPGAMHPAALGAESTVDRMIDCQYCCQSYCPSERNFACADVPVHHVLEKTNAYFASQSMQ